MDLSKAGEREGGELRVAQMHLLRELILVETADAKPTLYAFDRANLNSAWVATIHEATKFTVAEGPDVIYLVSAHYVHAINSGTGTRALRLPSGLAAPPLRLPFTPTGGAAAQSGTFYVPSLGSPGNNKNMESFSGVTGQRGWGYRAHGRIRGDLKMGGSWGDPKLYFATHRGKLVCMDAKNYAYRPADVRWDHWLDDPIEHDFFVTRDASDGKPGAIFAADRSGGVYCIDRITGVRRWVNHSGQHPVGGVAVFGDVCVVPMASGLYAYDTTNVLYNVNVDRGNGEMTSHTVRGSKLFRVGGGATADIQTGGSTIALTLEIQGEVLYAAAAGDDEAQIVVNGSAAGNRAAVRGGDSISVGDTQITIVDRGQEPLWKDLEYERAVARVGDRLVVANGSELSVVNARTGEKEAGPVALPGARIIPANTDDGTLFVVGGDAVVYALLPR
ncbi:MAG: PQQ-binding-like beta-propeller repeat protein [Planctomycetota bacterium]